MAERRWHIREKEGNPKEPGVYQVVIIWRTLKNLFPRLWEVHNTITTRVLIELSEENYRNTYDRDEENGWLYEDGFPGETVYAWAPIDDIGWPELSTELPEGYSWEE